MQIREAFIEDAEEACQVLRRSIVELCELDHGGNTDALDLWLSNKTPRNLRRWITESHVFVAAEEGVMLGVAAIDNSGKITLNYVSPGARFRGVSKALIGRLEARALEFGVRTVTLESHGNRPRVLSFRRLQGAWTTEAELLWQKPLLSDGEATLLGVALAGAGQKRRDGL